MHASFFYILVTYTGFNPNTGCDFPLSVSLSWIRFHSVIQLEKAWWLMVWIQWGGKTCFLIWNSVTSKIWETLNHWCMCVGVCLPSSVECLSHISFYSISIYTNWNFLPIPPFAGRSSWFNHVAKQLISFLTKKKGKINGDLVLCFLSINHPTFYSPFFSFILYSFQIYFVFFFLKKTK